MHPTKLDRQFAKFLREARGEATFRDFAKKTGLSRSTLFRLENIEQSATLERVHKLLTRLDVRLDDVFKT